MGSPSALQTDSEDSDSDHGGKGISSPITSVLPDMAITSYGLCNVQISKTSRIEPLASEQKEAKHETASCYQRQGKG